MRRAPETHTAAQNRRGRVSDGSRSYGRSKVPRHKGQRHMTAGDAGGATRSEPAAPVRPMRMKALRNATGPSAPRPTGANARGADRCAAVGTATAALGRFIRGIVAADIADPRNTRAGTRQAKRRSARLRAPG